MGHTREQEHGLQLAQVEAIAAARYEGREADQLISFIRTYFETTPEEIISGQHPPQLFAIAEGHWQFAQTCPANEALVRVFKPEDEKWDRDACVLETVTTDCPFLVDSVIMAVRAAGSAVRWIVHPVLAVQRDGEGRVQGVSSPESGKGTNESLIHIHIDDLGDETAYAALQEQVAGVLRDLRCVVNDFPKMRARLRAWVERYQTPPKDMDADEIAEVGALLSWLDDDHFTYLGVAENEVREEQGELRFAHKSGTGLGLQRGQDGQVDYIAPAAEMDKYARSRRPLVVTKANVRSHLHHHEYFDSIAVKEFNEAGEMIGTCRFLGLFSSEVYNSLPRRIPYVRRKIQWVMEKSRLREGSHAAKQLQEILDSLPRDELFQSSEQELFELAMGVRALRESQQLRLFMRRDRYGRFFSCLVYLNREKYSPAVRQRMGEALNDLLDGSDIEHHVSFQRDGLARIQYIIRTRPGSKTALQADEVEVRLLEAIRSWDEALRDYLCKVLPDDDARVLARKFHGAFAQSYREQAAPVEAATDLQYLNRLTPDRKLLVRLLEVADGACDLRLKVYVHGEPATLSEVLPTLENFGLTVLAQHPYEVDLPDGTQLWVQDFDLKQNGVCIVTNERMRSLFEEAFLKTWYGEAENDGIHRLVISAGLDWREAALMRAMCKYLLQTGWPYSQSYIESILAEHAELSRRFVELFAARFDPQQSSSDKAAELENGILKALDQVSSLDADRVLRGFLCVVQACLRTNYYQSDEQGQAKTYISLKLNPALIPELPLPKPMFETFVYSPEVEGIHLRGGKVARGGLRWSDRREDFRTEVLGLVKAQMVKNAVIVPVGAKGGFVVKRRLEGLDRDAFMQAGIACYKTFIRALLDITDNLVDGDILPPTDVVRHDEDDPYLVVAADKGTATFSDIANSVSEEYGFWLGDAFASGGSAGYDHKKMGITARGAWESVKRHFREMGVDCQSQDFTCVAVGDMAGDVFGNGMLLSKHTRLVAAFNHLHIFIDPDPDSASSYEERKRLFELPRSSWTDYQAELISEGGGIFERKAKSIELSPQAQKALGISESRLSPTKLIQEILKAPVDLFWNGGIGTYVKARSESHLEVGDRANDNLRINGTQLRCKIVGEGGNLGLTQLGRIEFALNGGRVITDFNDNAGGVNSSDREVNIKIPLNRLMGENALALDDRNSLLESMTDDVADAVLRDNYLQTQALSLMQQHAVARLDEHGNFIRMLEKDGMLNRAIEFLPDDERIADRRSEGKGLTSPELAVLLSYGKISLFDAVTDTDLPDDEYLSGDLLSYFPPALRAAHEPALREHRLRREIIATLITNDTVNRMGVTYAHRIAEDQGISRDLPVKSYLMAREIFAANERFEQIEALDLQLPTQVQYQLLDRVTGLLKHASVWLLNQGYAQSTLGEVQAQFGEVVAQLEAGLDDILPPVYQDQRQAYAEIMRALEVPEAVATAYANHHVIGAALDIALLAQESQQSIKDIAALYFDIGAKLSLPWILSQIISLEVEGRWQALARNNLRDESYQLHARVVASVLRREGDTVQAQCAQWLADNEAIVSFSERRIAELQTAGAKDFASLSVALRELKRLSL